MDQGLSLSQKDHEWRIYILVTTLIMVVFIFRIHLYFTLATFECWTMQDVWEAPPYIYSPLNIYITTVLLILLWAVIETVVSFSVSKSLSAQVASIFTIIATIGFLVVLFHFWQYFRISSGEIEYESFWWKISKLEKPTPYEPYDDFPHWNDFIIQERCDNGKAISTMTDKERRALIDKYYEMANEHYKTKLR